MASIATERFILWIHARGDGRGVAAFRRVFGGIWLVYDFFDLTWGLTERSRSWFPHLRESHLVWLQLVLIASGAMLVLGKRVWIFGMIAAAARSIEAIFFFPLNDFYFGSVMYLLLAHSEGGPFSSREQAPSEEHRTEPVAPERPVEGPKWVHDLLLLELAWIYFATATLKLNPDWLGGGHLFVRAQYLSLGHGWPYPACVAQALGHLAVDAALAKIGVFLEFALAATLFARGPYWLGVGLAVTIHTVGALLTNVWFFSASMIAGVVLLLPHPRRNPSTAP